MKPIVAIVGRPNVGKSTFFNRITRTRDAIVDDLPGVTRDRNFGNAIWNDIPFTVVDTGGFIQNKHDILTSDVHWQIKQAINEADAVIVVLDGKGGLSPFDKEVIRSVEKNTAKTILYVVNKVDGPEQEYKIHDFYSLGIKEFYPISAEHGYGISHFLDELVEILPRDLMLNAEENIIHIAVVGRPNVGKSSLINSVIGKNRMLVSDIPGTTRDPSKTEVLINNKSYIMVDTAGIRRKGKVSKKIEKFSVIKTLKRISDCHVALILIDVVRGITEQDVRIAGYAYKRGCSAIFVVNKCDLIERERSKILRLLHNNLRTSAKFLSFAPIIGVSALTGLHLKQIFNLVDKVFSQYSARISTGRLNRIFEKAIETNAPSLYRGKRIKFYYAAQITTSPPTIISFVNYPEAIHFSYKRYLVNRLRKSTKLLNTPLKLIFRQRTGRILYNKKKKR